MKTLVVGASGETGKLLVEQLLASGRSVKVVVRSTSDFFDTWGYEDHLTVIKRNITEITVEEMSEILADCDSMVSCLGHNLTLKGIYGKPRRLVADTVRVISEAIFINAFEMPVRFILLNTAGNVNRDLDEPLSTGQKLVLGLVRILLPPHQDNEKAADYLRIKIGQNNRFIEWVAVRPDTLIDEAKVSTYSLHNSPTRSAIFDPGKTSRINVGHFMTALVSDDQMWSKWKGKMPVIYDVTEEMK